MMQDRVMPKPVTFSANGREYKAGAQAYVVICLDGSADAYIDAAIVRGVAPTLARFAARGARFQARAIMPTFTNPNNTGIITGVPPALNGMPGNYFFDREAKKETMMNGPEFVRCGTIPAAAATAGRRVAVVTAKDKLRTLLAKGMTLGPGAIALSAEKAAVATRESAGVEGVLEIAGAARAPEIYSAEASLFVLRLGFGLLARNLADVLYLSTTDYIQHAHAPEEPEALAFYAGIDAELARLDALGAVIGITADHGMNAKAESSGKPNVVYLKQVLRELDSEARVILPITDPYVAHHAALGSYAAVHLSRPETAGAARALLLRTPGVTEVFTHEEAVRMLELPADRTADLVVCSGKSVVLGISPEHHDLSALAGSTLRSHGGRYEEMVPLMFNRPVREDYRGRGLADCRNFDVFDFTINGTKEQG